MQLPNDLYEQIFMNLDINTIINFTKTNKKVNIDNFEFWKAKFDKDNLPLLATVLPYTQKGWIKEYIKTQIAINKKNIVLDTLKDLQIDLFYITYDPSIHLYGYDYIDSIMGGYRQINFRKIHHCYPVHSFDDDIQDKLIYLFYHIPNMIVSNVEGPAKILYINNTTTKPNLIIIRSNNRPTKWYPLGRIMINL